MPGVTYDSKPTRYLDVFVVADADNVLSVNGYVLRDTATNIGTNGHYVTDPEVKSSGYTNSLTQYDFEFSKAIAGNQGDKNKRFAFTLTISGANPGVYPVQTNDVTDDPVSITVLANGTATAEFALTNNSTVKIIGLNKDAVCKVEENAEDYTATYSIDGSAAVSGYTAGPITLANNDHSVAFTNTRNGVIPGIDNTLAPGKYYLTEVTPPDGHDANEDDIIFTVFANGVVAIDSVGHSGYLSVEGTTECNYILRVPNSPNRPVELTITKTVTGAFGDKTKEFTFTLNVENAEPSDEYAWSKNGVPQAEPLRGNSTFTLRHGESVKITLPIFRRITITESNENYSTSFKLNDTAASVGNTKTFTLSGDSTLAVTNNLDAVIPTGVFHTAVGIAIIILAAFCLLAIPVILKRTQKIKG